MDENEIELETVDSLGAGAVGDPGERAFFLQARTESAQLTVLVEKEQVALLATEAVAFLDRIAEDYPEGPSDVPAPVVPQAGLREPTVPLFRGPLIGLGFDPEREMVLIELRERSSEDEEEVKLWRPRPKRTRCRSSRMPVPPSPIPPTRTKRATCADLRHPRAGPGDGSQGRGGGCRRPAAVPAVRHADGPRRAPVPPAGTERRRRRRSPGRGELEVLGRMPWASNATLLAIARRRRRRPGDLQAAAANARCGTSRAARCASAKSRRTSCPTCWGGASCPTVLREGPLGVGMVQRFVDHDPEEHYFTLLEENADRFRQFAVFDVLVNNADRKGGHCIRSRPSGAIVGIDHGLTFHPAWKLRTVIWDFAGEAVSPQLADDVCRVAVDVDGPARRVSCRFSTLELDAVRGAERTS